MNRIVIENNSFICDDTKKIKFVDNKFVIVNNGEYVIEYRDNANISFEIEISKGVTAKIFVLSIDNDINTCERYVLCDNSNLILEKFYDNNKTLERVIIDLDGECSKASYSFSGIGRDVDEYYYIVGHNNNRATSSLSNRMIGLDGSKISFKIDSKVSKGNVDCVMDQKSRIITLGDVDAKIVPNMFIDEDSVNAKHGSVISNIRGDDIFYLMSRGIREDEAIYLLLKGFILANLSVGDDSLNIILDRLNKIRR